MVDSIVHFKYFKLPFLINKKKMASKIRVLQCGKSKITVLQGAKSKIRVIQGAKSKIRMLLCAK